MTESQTISSPWETSQGPVLDEIEKEALDQFVPIIRKETAAFLRTMTAALKPSAILEIGTAVGYSALQMCRVMPEHCRITTIEKYEKRLPIARENFHRARRKRTDHTFRWAMQTCI